MARVSIYVSDELKARMDEARDALNWSDIARPAFETALATLNHRKGQNMQTAIERLRASKVHYEQEQDSQGKAAGREWAANRASFQQLKTLSTLDAETYNDLIDSIWPALKSTIDPGNELSQEEAAETLFGEHRPEDDYMVAFVEGAQEFFEEVEGEL